MVWCSAAYWAGNRIRLSTSTLWLPSNIAPTQPSLLNVTSMSDNPLVCQLPGCEGAPPLENSTTACKHHHCYHGVPVSFDYKGHQYIVTHSNNRYTCPLPDCGKPFKQRDGIEGHIIADHGITSDIKILAPPPSEHCMTFSNRRVFILT